VGFKLCSVVIQLLVSSIQRHKAWLTCFLSVQVAARTISSFPSK